MAFPINQQWDRGIRTALQKNLREPVTIDVEYIDSYRLGGMEVKEKWFELLQLKYRDAQPDLVIPVFDPAAVQYLMHSEKVFSDAAVVICSVNERTLPKLNIAPGIAGVHYRIDYRGTVDLARHLSPDLNKLIVVCGADEEVQVLVQECQADLGAYPGLEIDYWIGLPMEELFAQSREAPAGSAILYLTQDRDRDGRSSITPHEVAQRLSESSSVPVFGLYDTLLGSGILGGVMVRVEDQGLRAGWIASQILNGRSPSDFPFAGTDSNRAMIDWRQLKRWGIDEKRLPDGTLVLLREATFWQKYSTYVAASFAIFGLQSLLIGGLLINRKHRVKAESALASQLRFKTFHAEITSRLIHLNAEQLPEVLASTLRDISRDFGCDAGAIFRWEADSRHLQLAAGSWQHADLESGISLDLSVFSNVWSRLERGGLVLMNSSATSAEASDDRQWCRFVGVSACIVLPIRSQGNQPAVAIYGRWQGELQVAPEVCQPLRILTEYIANVMARVQAEEQLMASRRTSQQLAAKLLTAQEDERRHLAREMHDDITQRLAAAAMECGQLQKRAELPHEPQKVVSGLLNSLIQLSTDVHQLSRRMHPSILDDLGLLDALLHECNSARAQSKIALSLRCGLLPDGLSKDIQLCIYRVVQECLRNMLKHSQASCGEIVLSADAEWVHLQASDNGRGMPANQERVAPGLGLVAMQERVQLVGGEMCIISDENDGTCIQVRLPTKLDASLLKDAGAAENQAGECSGSSSDSRKITS